MDSPLARDGAAEALRLERLLENGRQRVACKGQARDQQKSGAGFQRLDMGREPLGCVGDNGANCNAEQSDYADHRNLSRGLVARTRIADSRHCLARA